MDELGLNLSLLVSAQSLIYILKILRLESKHFWQFKIKVLAMINNFVIIEIKNCQGMQS